MFEYTSNEELLITLFDGFAPDKMQQQDPIIKVPLNIGEIIDLDNGTAYLGFS